MMISVRLCVSSVFLCVIIIKRYTENYAQNYFAKEGKVKAIGAFANQVAASMEVFCERASIEELIRLKKKVLSAK